MGSGFMGGVAAMIATIATYPFDLIRTRKALQGNSPVKHFTCSMSTIPKV